MPILIIVPDIIYKLVQYNFFSSPSDIIFKNQSFYSFLIEDKNNKNKINSKNQIKLESRYTILDRNDISNLNRKENILNNKLILNDNSDISKNDFSDIDHSKHISNKKNLNPDFLVENIVQNKINDYSSNNNYEL